MPPQPEAAPAPAARPAGEGAASDEDERLLDRLAEQVVRRRMTVPAILLLESVKPLSFIGSQALYFFEPIVRALFTIPEYERYAAMIERRENIETLLVRIEVRDAEARSAERAERDRKRAERDRKRAEREAKRRGKETP